MHGNALTSSSLSLSWIEKNVRFSFPPRQLQYYKSDDSDPSLVWYSSSDYNRFKQDRLNDAFFIKAIQRQQPLTTSLETMDGGGACFWGLESLIIPELKVKILHTKANIRTAVLMEQDFQHRRCKYNPDNICKSSRTYSEWTELVARKKGEYYSAHIWCINFVFRHGIRCLSNQEYS